MRFIVDECCHRLFATRLRDAGHDVSYVAETNRRLPDTSIAALALGEDRIVVTADYDFGELAIRHRLSMPGVILLAPSRQMAEARARRLVLLVDDRDVRLLRTLTIVEDDRVRFRALE